MKLDNNNHSVFLLNYQIIMCTKHRNKVIDDVIVFRLEGKKLFMDHNGADGTVLDNNYILGTRFKVKMVVYNNTVYSYYNDILKETYPINFTGAYFKAGAYVQSSCKCSKQVAGELCSAYGEVVIFKVTVTHN